MIVTSWETFQLHKRGNAPEEFEDATAGDPDSGCFAVADGAAESSFATSWARLLVNAYVADPWYRRDPNCWLAKLRQQWGNEVDGHELPWYAEEKRQQGAYATFLGVTFRNKGLRQRWFAVAAGDCCLFQVGRSGLCTAFPLIRSDDFNCRPTLIGSRPESLPALLQRLSGRASPGDRFYLMTDALSQWFLREYEQGQQPWDSIDRIAVDSPNSFTNWITELRDNRLLRNDDTTLLRVEL
jgi:hypothetical protein